MEVKLVKCGLVHVEIDGKICDGKLRSVQEGKVVFLPSTCDCIWICSRCFEHLLRKRYIDLIPGVALYLPWRCLHRNRAKRVIKSGSKKVFKLCDSCFSEFLHQGYIAKVDGYVLGEWF